MRRLLVFAFFILAALPVLAQNQQTVRDGMQAITDRYGVFFVYDSDLAVDQPFAGQSLKKKSLANALKVLFDNTGIEWIRKGKYVLLKASKPTAVIGSEISSSLDTIAAASITGKIDRDINFTQTGLTRIDGAAFNRAYAVLSSPDVLKTLQVLPGVASGTELLSNLYVHGGDGNDNLFLLDGVPLYQVCHLGGIFSSFNTDVIESLDFYKSGFPARYGGRTSSVVDVITRVGSFERFKGQASIGLLEGRIQFEGPIIKDKSSFNVALRRSWADAIMYPVCVIRNQTKQKECSANYFERSMLLYSFMDFNAKLTHKFSSKNILSVNFYWGNDFLKRENSMSRIYDIEPYGDYYGKDSTCLRLNWGNLLASLNWNKDISDDLDMNIVGFWSASRSIIRYSFGEDCNGKWQDSFNNSKDVANHNVLDDIGATANLKLKVADRHLVRFGFSGICHSYRPDYIYYESEIVNDVNYLDLLQQDTVRAVGAEMSVYAEDEVSLARRLKVNIGLRNTLYATSYKVWNSFEPRLALKYHFTDGLNVKLSYARMSQFSHRMVSTYLDLPTNCWLPSTPNLSPISSHQFAAGVYSQPAKDFHFNIEGWYKTMDNMVEYYGDNTFFPRLNNWESVVYAGRGRSYGLEADFGYETKKLALNVFYTLSWSERQFERICSGWYRDRNDNRHKLTLMANWRASKNWELYAAWNFHSGNRMTLPTQYVQRVYADGTGYYGSFMPQWLYEEPNNAGLPDYHRLDFGANKHGMTRRGRQYVWNISVYNVYCHLNPVFATVERQGISRRDPGFDPGYVAFKGIGTSIVPILPSFSYKLYF